MIAVLMVRKVEIVDILTSHAAPRRPQHYAGEGFFQDGSKPLVWPLQAKGQEWASAISRALLSEVSVFQQMA